MVCHFAWALTTLFNKLLTQLSFPFWSFLSFLPAHQVHDLAWLLFLGKWHDFVSTIYICICLYLISHLQVFFPFKELTSLWSSMSQFSSSHLTHGTFILPHHFTEITLIKVTNDTCWSPLTGLLCSIWHCWTLSCISLPWSSHLNYWPLQGSVLWPFPSLRVLPGQSQSPNTYNNSTLTPITSRSTPPLMSQITLTSPETEWNFFPCQSRAPFPVCPIWANNTNIYLVQVLSILFLLYFSLSYIFTLFHSIVI